MSGPVLKATVNVRTTKGRFPAGSYVSVLSPARAALARDVQRAFARKADPVSGAPWKPRKHSYAHEILVRTGTLRTAAIAAAAGATINGSSLIATIPAPKYATYQQRGTRTIAARRFLGASIGTIGIVRAGLIREGRAVAVRVLRGQL